MNIPSKVKVSFKEYTVKEEVNLHDDGVELYGQIHYVPQIIQLNADSSDDQKKATLLHETIHALDEVYRINLEEEQVEKLANALYVFVNDNQEMFENEKEEK